jgi:hypothetical protein
MRLWRLHKIKNIRELSGALDMSLLIPRYHEDVCIYAALRRRLIEGSYKLVSTRQNPKFLHQQPHTMRPRCGPMTMALSGRMVLCRIVVLGPSGVGTTAMINQVSISQHSNRCSLCVLNSSSRTPDHKNTRITGAKRFT